MPLVDVISKTSEKELMKGSYFPNNIGLKDIVLHALPQPRMPSLPALALPHFPIDYVTFRNGIIGLVLLGMVSTGIAVSQSGRGGIVVASSGRVYYPPITPAPISAIVTPTNSTYIPHTLEDRIKEQKHCSLLSPNEPLSVLLNGKPSCLSPKTIDQILEEADSPLAGLGQVFYDEGITHGIDPAFALAVCFVESGCGKDGAAITTKSIGNIRPGRSWTGDVHHTANNGDFRKYGSWEEGIEDFYRLIRGPGYVGEGRTTVESIIPKYAPYNPSVYIAKVRKFYNDFVQREINSSNETDYGYTNGLELVREAESYIGTPYRLGGNDPDIAIDCSRLVQLVFESIGIELPRVSRNQFNYGTPVGIDELIPGDVVFFDTIRNSRLVDHVGIYAGDGEFIHASSSKGKVTTANLDSSYWSSRFVGGRRMTD